jgi:hypothetical protein
MIMQDLPFPWCVYAEHQSRAARCARITNTFWGIENGLTKLLTSLASDSLPENQAEFRRDVERTVATCSWVERNHTRLHRKYLWPGEEHSERRILARIRLTEIHSSVSAADWSLLMGVAAGITYGEMTGVTVGSARTRIARLRARLRQGAGKAQH